MNSFLKSHLISTFNPSWETERSGSVIRVFVHVYQIGCSKPIVLDMKFKRWCEPPLGDYTIYDKAYSAYSWVRSVLLSYTTVAVLRREDFVKMTLRFLSLLWKEYSTRGEDVPDGDYEKYGKFVLEIDMRREPRDRLAIVCTTQQVL